MENEHLPEVYRSRLEADIGAVETAGSKEVITLVDMRGLIHPQTTADVAGEVMQERGRQDQKWGLQDHTPVEWISILGEEFGEAAQAANDIYFVLENCNQETRARTLNEFREELLQVAAVAVAAVEDLDRKFPRIPGK